MTMPFAPCPALSGARLMIVEDQFLLAMDLVDALEPRGVQIVGPFANVRDAVAAARGEALDGAILDIDLGGELSFPIAEALAERGTPFLFASAFDAITLPEGLKCAPRLAKPFSHRDLLAAIDAMLTQRLKVAATA